jgi:flagellar hook-length control protein FliK
VISPTPDSTAATVAAAHVSPAGQIGPALLTLGTGADGTQQLTLRLQPEDLGTVQIRIDRAPDGTSQVNITADEPSTLQTITSEQSELHKALDAAGISAEGRTVTFGLTPQGSAAAGSTGGSANLIGFTTNNMHEDASAGQQSMTGGGANAQGSANGSSGGAAGDARQEGDGRRSAYQPVFTLPAASEQTDQNETIS